MARLDTRIPLHVSRSRGCVPVDSTPRSGLFKACIKLRFRGWRICCSDGILETRVVVVVKRFGCGGVDGFFENVEICG